MYISRSQHDGGLQGWLRDGVVDFFLWFEGSQLVQAQICTRYDIAEWVAPGRLQTGKVREGQSLNPGAGLIDFDRKTSPERLEAIRLVLRRSTLWPEAKALAEALLNREAPASIVATVETAIRIAPGAGRT